MVYWSRFKFSFDCFLVKKECSIIYTKYVPVWPLMPQCLTHKTETLYHRVTWPHMNPSLQLFLTNSHRSANVYWTYQYRLKFFYQIFIFSSRSIIDTFTDDKINENNLRVFLLHSVHMRVQHADVSEHLLGVRDIWKLGYDVRVCKRVKLLRDALLSPACYAKSRNYAVRFTRL